VTARTATFNGADQRRRGMIAKVKVAQKQLGLDEDTYRALLQRVTGKRSAADLNVAELEAVIGDLVDHGFKPTVIVGGNINAGKTAAIARADHPSARKARAMWISLHQLGVVRDPSEKALEAFAARQLKIDRLQWADVGDVYKLIEALKAMAERAGWSQDLAGIPAALHVPTLKARLQTAIDRVRQEAEAQ
jgi:phage gp16-like protein